MEAVVVNLFDIARQSGSGSGLDALARQFGIGPAETQRAVEALLPAFTLAFQRNATNPAAFAELIGAIGSGRYASIYDSVSPARAPDGHAILDQLFRSPEATRMVVDQTARMTGVGAEIIAAMLPTLAGLLIGGMFRFASAEGFADLLRQWSEALKVASRNVAASASSPQPQPTADPWTAWADVAAAMMGAGKPAPKPAAPAGPVEAWTAMMAAMVPSSARPAPTSAPPPVASPFDALSQMFETGREVQAQHLATLQAIMDGVWGKPQAR